MTYATLAIKEKTLTLPDEWVKQFPSKNIAATWLGDVLVMRPIKTVSYSKSTEAKALRAVVAHNQDKKAGRLKKLEGKLSNLLN